MRAANIILDFVRTAEAKGLTNRTIRNRHVLRNALLPVITVTGLLTGRTLVYSLGFAMMAKAIVPRYRYDQLMRLGWKVFLPVSLGWVVLTAAVLQFGGWLPGK